MLCNCPIIIEATSPYAIQFQVSRKHPNDTGNVRCALCPSGSSAERAERSFAPAVGSQEKSHVIIGTHEKRLFCVWDLVIRLFERDLQQNQKQTTQEEGQLLYQRGPRGLRYMQVSLMYQYLRKPYSLMQISSF